MEAKQKKILKPLCLTLRHLLEGRYDEHGKWHGGDLEEQMNALGVWWDRDSIPTAEMVFRTPEDKHARKVIDAYLALREDAGLSRKDAIEEFVREAAYTWVNRLLVLRCMEARDLIDGVVTTKEVYGGRSLAHHRLAQRQPETCAGEDGGLFAMLDKAFSFHANHLPVLFNPKAPAAALRPSVAALKKCIALLSGTESVNGSSPATDEVFAAPDALGWAYQYWNTEEKDRVFAKVRTKKVKIQGADIIPATQLYTESYMVRFLVQNSLGATWMGMHPDSDLLEDWEYYVKDADRAPVRRKNVENITFLDPACGSGHFLIEAFDLFYRMYEAEGKYTDPEAICKKILSRNLYGIDIDERAVQITRAALWMKAAERVFDFSGTPKNIIATNIRLPKGKDHLKAFLAKYPEDAPLAPALESIFEGLEHADELGSLLQIEEPVERELRSLRTCLGGQTALTTGGLTGQTSFAGAMTDEDWEAWKDDVIERLADHFGKEGEAADFSSAFFSQNAGKGVRLFELLSKRYDVVAVNPPYMGSGNMGSVLKKYVNKWYKFGKNDLFASFIIRSYILCKRNGKAAMVTQQSWMFLRSFSNLRLNVKPDQDGSKGDFNGILLDCSIDSIIHLGSGAFHEITGDVVNVALFILSKIKPTKNHNIVACRLIGVNGAIEKENYLKSSLRSNNPKTLTAVSQTDLYEVPDYQLLYWLPKDLLSTFTKYPLLKEFADTTDGVTGLARLTRFDWESSCTVDRRWIPYSKGGGYARWSGLEYYRCDWQYDGARQKAYIDTYYPYLKGNYGFRLKYRGIFPQIAFCFSSFSSGGICCRLLETEVIVGDKGPAVIPISVSGELLLAILNTRVPNYLLRAISGINQVQYPYVLKVPVTEVKNEFGRILITNMQNLCLELKEKILNYEELNLRHYSQLFLHHKQSTIVAGNCDMFHEMIMHSMLILLLESTLEEYVASCYRLSDNTIKLILSETGTPAGWHPLIAIYDTLPPLPDGLPEIPQEVLDYLAEHERRVLSPEDLTTLKANLRTLYEAGPGAKIDIEVAKTPGEEEEIISGAYIPIPAETFLEELSQKLQIHPISVYWLLTEGIEQEGWRCIPEEQRITADRFTVMILRMLGHRWPKQIEAGEPVPDWADAGGIIPLTSGTGEATLLERVRVRIAEEFPDGSVTAIEREFEEVMGKSLEDWLNTEFFKHHTKQFKRRPIAWQVQSGRFTKRRQPAFACLVYYHKLDDDTLHKIKNQYVGPLRQRYETEMRGIEGISPASRTEAQEQRFRELEGLIAELKTFEEILTDAVENGFSSETLEKIAKSEPLDPWCSIDGKRPAPADHEAFLRQEKSYIPDINDGVRVNVAPLQKAGLLAANVITKKNLEKAISDRAEWRADERRWCREGKLPECGWWS